MEAIDPRDDGGRPITHRQIPPADSRRRLAPNPRREEWEIEREEYLREHPEEDTRLPERDEW